LPNTLELIPIFNLCIVNNNNNNNDNNNMMSRTIPIFRRPKRIMAWLPEGQRRRGWPEIKCDKKV